MPLIYRGRLLANLVILLLLGTSSQSSPIYRGYQPSLEDTPQSSATASEPAISPPMINTAEVVVPTQPNLHPTATQVSKHPAAATLSPPVLPQAPPEKSNCPNCRLFPTPKGQPSLLSLFRRSTQEPPRLVPTPTPVMQSAPCQTAGCTSAIMLKPIPSSSTFVPAERVSNQSAVVSTMTAVTRPQPSVPQVSFTPAPRLPETIISDPANSNPNQVIANDQKPEKLPSPMTENGEGKNASPANKPLTPQRPGKQPKPLVQGYPELPQPTVTNPPAAPREHAKRALSDYIIEPPDVLQIDLSPVVGDKNFPVRGTHLVGSDGKITLGPYGGVYVAGLTVEQAKWRVADRITKSLFKEHLYFEKFREVLQGLKVDVAAYNSKYYYVIADGGGYGEQVYRILCTGNETILDAIAQVEGLPRVASKGKIWIARATPSGAPHPQILPVDWIAVTQLGMADTNYQIYPGDRIYINSDPLIRADSFLAKIFSPIERVLGITLLGSTTVNSIRNSNQNQNQNFR